MLTVGMKAPDFSLIAQDGKRHQLSQYLGKLIVVYFYPKDNTPGCTTEACDFRDNMAQITAHNAVVFGISKDNSQSHEKFIQKHALNFNLLSDPELKAYRAYGAMDEEKTVRSTFLIDPQGNLLKIWPKVQVKGHVNAVLLAMEEFVKSNSQ